MNPHRTPSRIPATLSTFINSVLPLIHSGADGPSGLRLVEQIIRTDRWNNFSEFHETTKTIVQAFEKAGSQTEVYPVPTGGHFGTGKWIIHEAQDVLAATLDIVAPIRLRLADYRENPWHAVQWTAATPPEGKTCDLVAIDSIEQLQALKPGALRNKIVLISMNIWDRGIPLAKKEAYGVICESNIKDCPDSVAWAKFGWGGFPIHQGPARMVGMVLSANQAAQLRGLITQHGRLQVHIKVDVRRFAGTHDVVSGLIPGRDDPQSEVWSVAHSAEPGAIDNASGVACNIEIARTLNHLIDTGKLPRPRRTIRLLSSYECYGFFHYLEYHRRFQTPLAGICLDGVGARPEDCEKNLFWNATVPASASFVDQIGPEIVKAALALDNPGYVFAERPFVSTEDTLLGDPIDGFPCPWFSNHPVVGYHSSADDMSRLDPRGFAVCTAAAAAYLYYLADAGTDEALELADWQTQKALAELSSTPTRTAAQTEYLRHRLDASLQRLQRFLWTGEHAELTGQFQKHREVFEAAAAPSAAALSDNPKPPIAAADSPPTPLADLIPLRKLPLAPTAENVLPPHNKALGPRKWTVYWANGKHSVARIHELLNLEPGIGKPVTLEWVAAHFAALRDLGFVELIDPNMLITQERLLADLRALGVAPGMDVMFHSAMSKIGHVQGGPATVIDALLEAIAPDGTLVAPSFNHSRANVYNPLTTPTINGAIPNALWRDPRAIRSVHGSHPVAAIGPKAAPYTADHLQNGIWSDHSPIARLIHDGGYILSIGVNSQASTAYHVAEVSMNAPCLDQFASTDRIVMPGGNVQEAPGLAWRDGPCPVDAKLMDESLDARHLSRHGNVGAAPSTLVRAADLYQTRRDQIKDTCPTCTVRPKPHGSKP